MDIIGGSYLLITVKGLNQGLKITVLENALPLLHNVCSSRTWTINRRSSLPRLLYTN